MYRDELDALTARHTALETEVAAKTRERDATAQLVEEAKAVRRLPVLDNIRVAAPCKADWSTMTGDDRSRHCSSCDTVVFDLSSLTRDEAEALIVERNGNLCARYYQRKDGTILTADCTVGLRKRRQKTAAVAAGLVAAFAGGSAIAIHELVPSAPTEETLADLPITGEPEHIHVGVDVVYAKATLEQRLEQLSKELDHVTGGELVMGQMITIVRNDKK